MEQDPFPDPNQPPRNISSERVRQRMISARLPQDVARGVFSNGAVILFTQTEFVLDFVQTMSPPKRLAARVIMTPIVFARFMGAVEQALTRLGHGDELGPRPEGVLAPEDRTTDVSVEEAADQPAGAYEGQSADQNIDQNAEQDSETTPESNFSDDAGPGWAAGPSPVQHEKTEFDSSDSETDDGMLRPEEGQPSSDRPNRPALREVYEEMKFEDEQLTGAYANTVRINHSQSEFCFDFVTSFLPHPCVSARVYLSVPQTIQLLRSIRQSHANYRKQYGR